MTTAKRERLEARITQEQKALFQRAADLSGRTLTDFVVASTQAAAEEIVRQRDLFVLSPRDSIRFVEALLSPPEPNEQLRAAAEHYRAFFVE